MPGCEDRSIEIGKFMELQGFGQKFQSIRENEHTITTRQIQIRFPRRQDRMGRNRSSLCLGENDKEIDAVAKLFGTQDDSWD